MWSRFAACAEPGWSSLPWCDDATERDAALMRWVCMHRCAALAGCRREVDAELAAGRVVVGIRAGSSPRQRARRHSRGVEEVTGDVAVSVQLASR